MYTKGEWKAVCLGSEGYCIRPNTDGMTASEVRNKGLITPIVYSMGGDFETQKTNAQLIAAAPDMYEALQELISFLINKKCADYDFVPYINKGTKALKKAGVSI